VAGFAAAISSTLGLALEALDTADVHRPRQGRATPALLCRMQLGAAVEGTHPQAIGRGVGARSRRIDRCAAFGAEPVRPLVPAFSGLDVDLRGAALQNKGAGQARHIRTKGRPGEGLTISAMADPDLGWVDFGLEADLTAMAASGDFHPHFSLDGARPNFGRDYGQDHSFGGFEQWRTAPRLTSNLSERRHSRAVDHTALAVLLKGDLDPFCAQFGQCHLKPLAENG